MSTEPRRHSYSTDATEEEWAFAAPYLTLLPEPRSTCQWIITPRPSTVAGVPLGHRILAERASKREPAGAEKLPRPAVPVLPLVVGDHRRSCGQRTRPRKVRGVELSGRGAMGAPAVFMSGAQRMPGIPLGVPVAGEPKVRFSL